MCVLRMEIPHNGGGFVASLEQLNNASLKGSLLLFLRYAWK